MIDVNSWLSNNYIEIFGAITGIIYVFLEIRQNIWLWPVGIITSAVYILVFFSSKFYADMSLQVYYLIISCIGWYWWSRGTGHRAQDTGQKELLEREKRRWGDGENEIQGDLETGDRRPETEAIEQLVVRRLKVKTGLVLGAVFVILYFTIWYALSKLTDSPVPELDSLITSLSIVATWMLARKIYEHWYLWIIVNFVSVFLFVSKGLYPTIVLYLVYGVMSFTGLVEWKKTIRSDLSKSEK